VGGKSTTGSSTSLSSPQPVMIVATGEYISHSGPQCNLGLLLDNTHLPLRDSIPYDHFRPNTRFSFHLQPQRLRRFNRWRNYSRCRHSMMPDKAQAAGPGLIYNPGSPDRPELCHSSTPREACTNNAFLTSTSRFRNERSPEPGSRAIRSSEPTPPDSPVNRRISRAPDTKKGRSRSLLCSVRIRLAPDGGGMAQVRGNGMECDGWGHTSVGLTAISIGF
jgi:hypothetical protein